MESLRQITRQLIEEHRSKIAAEGYVADPVIEIAEQVVETLRLDGIDREFLRSVGIEA